MTAIFLIDESGKLNLRTQNELLKKHAKKIESLVNQYFLAHIKHKDEEIVISSFKRRYNFLFVELKGRTQKIEDYLKENSTYSVLFNKKA